MAEELMYDEELPSVFWGLMMLLMFSSLLYLSFLGYVQEGIGSPTFQVGALMLLLMIGSVVLSGGKILYAEKNILYSAQGWLAGLLLFLLVGSIGEASLISVTVSVLDSQLAAMGDQAAINSEFWSWYIPNIASPVVEEAFWAVGFPVGIVLVMQSIAKSGKHIQDPYLSPLLSIFDHVITQMIVLVVVLSTTFAYFHVDQQASAIFIFAALLFRAVLTVIWWGDMHYDLVPLLVIAPSFLVGAHMGNNISVEGLGHSLSIIASHPIGWITMLIFGFIALIAVVGLHEEFAKLKSLLA